MTFVAGAVIWSAYTLSWWGWLALTDRVPPGQPNTFWWPSVRDLVSPGRQAFAVPPRLTPAAGTSQLDRQNAQDVAAWEKENAAAAAAGKQLGEPGGPNIIHKARNQP